MADDPIPADVLDFLLSHIDSIAELEALLLLRSDTDRAWTIPQMSARLYILEPSCAAVLDRLEAAGLCVRAADGFRYAAAGALAEIVDRTAYTYTHFLIPVTNVIHQKPNRIQQFADAFRFRKGK